MIRPEKSENWTLQIKFPQERDAGIYECQVNTEPKMSLAFQLNVVGKYTEFNFRLTHNMARENVYSSFFYEVIYAAPQGRCGK